MFRLYLVSWCFLLLLVPHDEAGADARPGVAAEVVGQSEARVLDLPRAGLALELFIHLVHHAQAAGAERVPEALKTAVGIDRQVARESESAGLYIFFCATPRAEPQVLVDDH